MVALPGAAAPRLLLIPSKAAEAPGTAAARHLSVVLPAGADPGLPAMETAQPARKRQRLTHLSPEEKALRRKLKNRVAAQSARDRKKARMTELEQQVVELEEEVKGCGRYGAGAGEEGSGLPASRLFAEPEAAAGEPALAGKDV
uniref:X-box-binding protein 1 n=1 Tax=Junco hyemalis TaxID=40217 RepID=A0A8C5JP44_JUNHY